MKKSKPKDISEIQAEIAQAELKVWQLRQQLAKAAEDEDKKRSGQGQSKND